MRHCFVNDATKHVFLNGEGLRTLILGIFTTKMLHKRNSVNRKFSLYGNDIYNYRISYLTNQKVT